MIRNPTEGTSRTELSDRLLEESDTLQRMSSAEIQHMKRTSPVFHRLRYITPPLQLKELFQIDNLKRVLQSPHPTPVTLSLTGHNNTIRLSVEPTFNRCDETFFPSVETTTNRIKIGVRHSHKPWLSSSRPTLQYIQTNLPHHRCPHGVNPDLRICRKR